MSRIEDEVCKKILERAEVGKKKYGVTMERTDFSILDWLIYAQEEALDFCVYLQRLIEELSIQVTTIETALRQRAMTVARYERENTGSSHDRGRQQGWVEALEFVLQLQRIQEEQE
jgi:hypothetical protein